MNTENKKTAVWAITPNGAGLARRIVGSITEADLFLSDKLEELDYKDLILFNKFIQEISKQFNHYQNHLFIMATGIVIRAIAPHIRHKTSDPAVVVIDELGQWVISLLSGHIGGANRLAEEVAGIIDAQPVITTATDLNKVPAIDLLAQENNLLIENPDAIKSVNMAFLTGTRVNCYDPMEIIANRIPDSLLRRVSEIGIHPPGLFVDDTLVDLPDSILILRPGSLAAGIGCNRNTPKDELKSLLFNVLEEHRLSMNSLSCLASIEVKSDEPGLLALSKDLDIPLKFYDRDQLNRVEDIVTPSSMVEKHVGVKSVCEASAILAADQGKLIVPKQNTKNVTVAIARKSYMS